MAPWLLPALALVGTPLLCAWWIRRALRLQLVDTLERRRLHDVPTPRGGGVAPVITTVLALVAVAIEQPSALHGMVWPILAGLLLVAGVSMIDDHGDVSVRVRLGVHVSAALVLAIAFAASLDVPGRWWVEGGAILVFVLVASMNLHNFMDGSDAHLAAQSLFVFAVLAVLSWLAGSHVLAALLAAMAVAVAAFLPFNWPRARVFLGDVGSISFGYLIAVFSIISIVDGSLGWGGALILSSGFMIDATATLIGRMRRTRHWLSPHRDHLYQWLRRCGRSPQRVVAIYQAWNLLIVLPALCVLTCLRPSLIAEFGIAFAVYALGLTMWLAARGALRRAHRAQ